MTLPDGTKYEGEFKDGNFNGQGTYIFPDGTKYIGQFKDGKFSGKGIYNSDDGIRYEGEFKDGEFNGQGTYTFPDGTKYEAILSASFWIGALKLCASSTVLIICASTVPSPTLQTISETSPQWTPSWARTMAQSTKGCAIVPQAKGLKAIFSMRQHSPSPRVIFVRLGSAALPAKAR